MKILLLNQCFWPDVVATAQQLTMLAHRLSARGHEVTVIASRRGYDNQNLRFPRRERWQGIKIARISSLSLGKANRLRRALNFGSFLFACAGRLLLTPRHDMVVALTSPPLISWLASLFTRLKGGRLILWTMDLNPDEAIAAGWLSQDSLTARFLSRLLTNSMRRAETIVALDRFMKDRVVAKGIAPEKVVVIPPAGNDRMTYDRKGREEFRARHKLSDKFVVMYAGNHSPCNPLDTLLDAAAALKHRNDIVFVFVGGGSEFTRVRQFAETRDLKNVRCLPYQPTEALPAVLSTADLHVAIMGDAFTGILHPSKIYNILSVGVPFLFIGPDESHISDIVIRIASEEIAMHVRHGDAVRVANTIGEFSRGIRDESRSRDLPFEEFSSDAVFTRFIGLIESAPMQTADVPQIGTPARTSPGRI